MKSKIFLGVVLVVIAVIATLGLFSPKAVEVPVQVGSVAGPDLYSPYFNVNGVIGIYDRQAFKSATTTVYSFRPGAVVSATSTLAHFGCRFDVSSTTASTVTIAKASSAFATTTVLARANIAAGAQAAIVATSTSDSFTFSGSEYVVVGIQGGIGTFSPSGYCSAKFLGL